MSEIAETHEPESRRELIVETLVEAFSDLMTADPLAFRRKFRKMAADPFAFYRGSACVFYADLANHEDRWAHDRSRRVWIQGDLHAENFGTYMNGEGILVFDVNDFDEAYLGHFTWDVKRFAASIALMCWTKAVPDDDIARLIEAYTRAYVGQVRSFVDSDRDHEFSLRLDSTEGAIHDVLLKAQLATRVELLNDVTVISDYQRRFRHGPGVRELDRDEREQVEEAFAQYLDTIPESKKFHGPNYTVKDIVGASGFGIGSAGLPAYNVLIEGRTQALENDVILSLKQGNVAAPSRVVHDERIVQYFLHHGHRTAVSQRALQAHTDPWLGYTQIDGVGFVVSELSPYGADLDWSSLTEPDEMAPVVTGLGQATAKIHCVSDSDSEQTLVDFQTEDAIMEVIGDAVDDFVNDVVVFGMAYGQVARDDHRLFVNAFRNSQIPGIKAT